MAKKTTVKASKPVSRKATIHEFPGSRAAHPAPRGPVQEPKGPHPKQKQPKPGLEAKMKPRPRYEAPAYRPAGKLK